MVQALRKTGKFFYSVSCTTRAPRAGEIEGEHYRFLSAADFLAQIAASDFLEHAKVHQDLYGTLREPVLTSLKNGVDVLIDIDTQSARLHSDVPQSRFHRVAGNGHMIQQTATDQVMSAIREVAIGASKLEAAE